MTTTLRSTLLPTFAVAINGVHRFTMGIEREGALGPAITFVRRENDPSTPDLTLDAGGLQTEPNGRLFVRWDRTGLHVSDTVNVRLNPPGPFDAPQSWTRETVGEDLVFHGSSEFDPESSPWPRFDSNGPSASDISFTPAFQITINGEPFCITQTQRFRVTMAIISAVANTTDPQHTDISIGPFLDDHGNQLPEPYRTRQLQSGDTISIRILGEPTP